MVNKLLTRETRARRARREAAGVVTAALSGPLLAAFAVYPSLTKAAHRCPPHNNAPWGTSMSYSLSEAATACGVYKSTVLRSIKTGRLTGTKDAFGQWRIEPAELHRVYPPAQSNGADGNGTRHGATVALMEAQHRAELAEHRLADLKAVLEDMRQDRDHWRVHAGRLALSDARARQPWWRRLAGLTPRDRRVPPPSRQHDPAAQRA